MAKVFSHGLNVNLYAMIWFLLADYSSQATPYGLLDANLNPRPAYTAYQVAAAEFGRASTVQALGPGTVGVRDRVEGYIFATSSGKTLWVLWASPGGTQTQITLPAAATRAKDMLGTVIPLTGNGQPTIYQLSDQPIYVEL